MFSFQVYPGNLLNTYHWRAVDADHVVSGAAGIRSAATIHETVRRLASRTARRRWKRTSTWSNRCSAA
jgi:hypothetical protein